MKLNEPCPKPDESVRKFAVWWMKNKPFRVPPEDGIRAYEGVYGVTLYREGPFQAQLFIVKHGEGSPEHCHPNIDSVEYGIAGADTFTSERNHRIHGLICVAPGELHTAAADEHGGAFISFQKWLNGVKPSSVELDWEGGPIDKSHAESIDAA